MCKFTFNHNTVLVLVSHLLLPRLSPISLNTCHGHFFFSQITEKNRELGAAQSEIKALKATEAQKDKALEEVTALIISNHSNLHIPN